MKAKTAATTPQTTLSDLLRHLAQGEDPLVSSWARSLLTRGEPAGTPSVKPAASEKGGEHG